MHGMCSNSAIYLISDLAKLVLKRLKEHFRLLRVSRINVLDNCNKWNSYTCSIPGRCVLVRGQGLTSIIMIRLDSVPICSR